MSCRLLLGALRRLPDRSAVFVGNLLALRHHIGAVDAEARRHLADRAPHLRPRIVALVAVRLADLHKQRSQPVHVAAQRLLRHGDLLLVRDRGEVRRLAR